jgi:exodeoxyribonuclease V alpha subunit
VQHSIDLFEEEEKFIKGKIITTIFHNEETLYSVARARILETTENTDEKEVAITGNFPFIQEEEVYTFFGTFKEHPRYGLQYQVHKFKKELPQTRNGIVLYLSSDLFKGIGKKTAEKIVDVLGEQAISKIMDDPEALERIPGIKKDKAKELYNTIMEHQGLEKVMGFLGQYNIGTATAIKIYQTYREETLEIVKKNPYQLIVDVDGIGFGRADEIGKAFGISGKHPDRIRAGCLYTLEKISLQDGHVYISEEQLIEQALTLLNNRDNEVTKDDISREIINLFEETRLVKEDGRVYLSSLYYAEKGFVASIQRMMSAEGELQSHPESEFLLQLGEIEEKHSVQYAPKQREAVQMALQSKIMLLTGGPGTGKTTVIKGIVEMYAALNGYSLEPKDYKEGKAFPILLAAPTGRAAKRMSEATGLPASTIHRLLGWTREGVFQHDEENQIQGKLLIVDEFSMVDIWLANQLFKSLPSNMQVIIVGDEDQLPSVGPGQVLKDMLDSQEIPTVQLTEIYRQAEGSTIIQLAHCMKEGKLPTNIYEKQRDRTYFPCSSNQIVDIVKDICGRAQQRGYTARDIQVLAPMYRGNAGIDILNKSLQEVFNPKKEKARELVFGDATYRVKDKVLQLVNRPEDGVYNGDIGEIVSIFYAKENAEGQDMIVVAFDDIEVMYMRGDFNQMTHAYCCSIHKSQGSEFPIVIVPVVKGYYRMLRRNLLYTAITRGKKSLILCGEYEALEQGIQRLDDQRQTTLTEKLKGETSSGEWELEVEDDLEDLSPYDFM